MDLVTIDEVKTYGGVKDLESDTILESLIDQVSADVEGYTGLTFESTPVSERREDICGQVIVPRRAPVASVQGVTLDGSPIPQSTAGDVVGWWLDGMVIRLCGYYVRSGQAVVLEYTAGQPAPDDLKLAVIRLVILAYRERTSIGRASESVGGYSQTFLPSIIPQTVRDVLDRYRIPRF
jgi:hypothetical protein